MNPLEEIRKSIDEQLSNGINDLNVDNLDNIL